jgi:hypothetical protein
VAYHVTRSKIEITIEPVCGIRQVAPERVDLIRTSIIAGQLKSHHLRVSSARTSQRSWCFLQCLGYIVDPLDGCQIRLLISWVLSVTISLSTIFKYVGKLMRRTSLQDSVKTSRKGLPLKGSLTALVIKMPSAELVSPSYSTGISAFVVVADGRPPGQAVVEHGLVLRFNASPAALVAVRVRHIVMYNPPPTILPCVALTILISRRGLFVP